MSFIVKIAYRLPDSLHLKMLPRYSGCPLHGARLRADLFLPCGGRPKSVNLVNRKSLLDDEGRQRKAVRRGRLYRVASGHFKES